MQAVVGDRITVQSAHIDERTRDGEVVEIRGADDGPP